MRNDTFPFENCSGFTEGQFTAVALARGITAAVSCTILLMVLAVLTVLTMFTQLRARLCGTVIKRLILGLTGVNAAYQLTLALHLVHYYHPHETRFCAVDGFFDQYFASVQLFLTLEICLLLFIKVLNVTTSWRFVYEYHKKAEQSTSTCCSRKINKLEVVRVATIIIVPLPFDMIPFTTDSYGPYGPWCWIRVFETDCSVHIAGSWEQVWLWYVPFGLVAVLTLGLFLASLCLLGYRIKSARVKKQIVVRIIDSVISLALMLALRILQTTAYFHFIEQDRYLFVVIYAICDPLSAAVIPLALLLAIHMPLSAVIVKCTSCKHPGHHPVGGDQRSSERRTQHDSSDWSMINMPSHTTYEPPHSSYESSETAPFANGKQQKHDNYGSTD